MTNTMLHMKLNYSASAIILVAAVGVFSLPSSAQAGVCFLPDCQDTEVERGNTNADTKFCEKKGFTFYADGKCPAYEAETEKCHRDDKYLKCDALKWCKDNGYNTTSCSIPTYLDTICPNNQPYYKQCKTDNARACREVGYKNTCPSGQKLKRTSGRCSWDSSYGTCCTPTSCPANTSLTSSSYGTNGTDGCEYSCYYTCNTSCPSGTSTSNPGGCGGSTRNGCDTTTCYYPYQSCCNSSSSNWCGVHSTCHGNCCTDGTLKSCDTQCGGSGCSSSDSGSSGGGASRPSCSGPANGLVIYPCQNFGCTTSSGATGWKYDGQYYTYGDNCETSYQSRFQYSGCDSTLAACLSRRGCGNDNSDCYR